MWDEVSLQLDAAGVKRSEGDNEVSSRIISRELVAGFLDSLACGGHLTSHSTPHSLLTLMALKQRDNQKLE